jgi:hypothetical protein
VGRPRRVWCVEELLAGDVVARDADVSEQVAAVAGVRFTGLSIQPRPGVLSFWWGVVDLVQRAVPALAVAVDLDVGEHLASDW